MDKNGPFDVLLDGANIGFVNQRVDKGDKLNWSQIERVVVHFMRNGEPAWGFLHSQHIC